MILKSVNIEPNAPGYIEENILRNVCEEERNIRFSSLHTGTNIEQRRNEFLRSTNDFSLHENEPSRKEKSSTNFWRYSAAVAAGCRAYVPYIGGSDSSSVSVSTSTTATPRRSTVKLWRAQHAITFSAVSAPTTSSRWKINHLVTKCPKPFKPPEKW